ncbi:MAG: cell division protein FtsW [Flavobacteriales bacterium TMED235]|nr:MAG: cell division protein FtsW [Flavobacteriales bacterium TMED235]
MKKIFDLQKFYYNWWKNLDKVILLLILFLFTLGLFFSLVSTSLIASDKLNTNSYHFFLKHLIFILISLITFIFFSSLEKNKLIKLSLILFFISFIVLLMVPILGTEVKGSRRWIDIGVLPRFQPIEILKPFFIVLIATILSSNYTNRNYIKYFLSLILTLPVILLLINQPDIGQTTLIVLTWFSLIFVSGINLVIFFTFFITIGIILSYLVLFVPKFFYIKNRIISFIDPSSGNNYQSERASEAIINGGFFGRGLGEGKLNSKIPEAHTDYIVSVISEEFGIILVIFIMFVYIFLAFSIAKKIDRENDNLVKLILTGSISILLIQTYIHFGVNIRILPTTGMTLPFISNGGSSIVGTAILSGIILNLTKRRVSSL